MSAEIKKNVLGPILYLLCTVEIQINNYVLNDAMLACDTAQ